MIRVAGAIATGLLVLMAVMHVAPWRSLRLPLHYNLTASLPLGLYGAEMREGVRRGDILRVCTPWRAAPVARARGYVGPGSCPGGTAPIGKMVLGLPGDTVFVSKEEIRIGSRTVLKDPLQERDTRGRLVRTAEGMHVLAAGECFVLSTYSPRSYDSRYFGPVECAPPFLVLTPVSDAARRRLAPLHLALQGDE